MPNPKIEDPAANLPFGYTEKKESGQEGYDWTNGILTATRIFQGPWANRQLFLQTFYLQATGTGGNNLIFAPAQHPELFIPAKSAKVTGKFKTNLNTQTNYIAHEVAEITVEYESQKNNGSNPNDPNNDFEQQYIEESVESSVELLPLSISREVYTGGTTTSPEGDRPIVGYNANGQPLYPVDENWQNYINLAEQNSNCKIVKLSYKLSMPYVTNPLWGRIGAALGTVNLINFTTPSNLVALNFPKTIKVNNEDQVIRIEQLRYDGVSGVTKREVTQGNLVWGIDHNFEFYQHGHNTEPTVDFILNTNNNTYITHKPIKPKLYYPYPLQAIFRALRTDEIIQCLDNLGLGAGKITAFNNYVNGLITFETLTIN